MALYGLGQNIPQWTDSVWVADSAQVIGKVHLLDHSSVWFHAVLRGDNEAITVGENSNIQDACVLHTDPGFPLVIGRNVSVGHGALLHGCTVGDGSLMGRGASCSMAR
jgi:carbonic anhydrase/acetyltransferase-like protein (isoleucine patch superfamily)